MGLRCVFFDLNGTLLDSSALGTGFDEALLLSMAETLSGSYRPLPELLAAVRRRRGEPEEMPEMPPRPGAAAALARIRDAGLRPCVLTNSATDAGEAALEAGGLRVDLVVGSDQVKAYKPDPRIYRRGLEAAGVRPQEACLVSAHAWDAMGAARVGMHTAWVGHKEGVLLETAPEPDVRAETLEQAAAEVADV